MNEAVHPNLGLQSVKVEGEPMIFIADHSIHIQMPMKQKHHSSARGSI